MPGQPDYFGAILDPRQEMGARAGRYVGDGNTSDKPGALGQFGIFQPEHREVDIWGFGAAQ